MSDEHSSQKQRILSQISNSLYTAAQKKESSYNRQFWKHKNTVGFHISHFSSYMLSYFNYTTAGHYYSNLLVNTVQLKIIKIEFFFQIVPPPPDEFATVCNLSDWAANTRTTGKSNKRRWLFCRSAPVTSFDFQHTSQASLFPQVQMKPKIWRTAFFWHDSLKILRSEVVADNA